MRFSAFLLLSLFVLPAFAQDEDAPALLIDAAQCMTGSKLNLLNVSQPKITELELGFRVNRKDYPGREIVDVVEYDNTMHTQGTVVTFLNEGKDPHRVLRYQYRVHFRQPEDGSRKVVLLDLPYGGIGTRNRIFNVIYDIGYSTYRIPMTEIAAHPFTACVSDARPEGE